MGDGSGRQEHSDRFYRSGSSRNRSRHDGGSRNYYDRDRERSRSPDRRSSSWNREDDRGSYSRRPLRRSLPRESKILILRGIPRRFSEQQLTAAVSYTTSTYEQFTFFQSANYNESRNSAVLRFKTVQEARDFLDANPRGLRVDSYHVSLQYGSGHDDGFWSCVECAVVNHESRSYCLQCGVQNKESEPAPMGINDGASDVGTDPSHILLVRGLDTLITEEQLYTTLRSTTEVARVWLVKDRLSRVSCGYGFLEFPTVLSASHVTNIMIEGKHIIPDYSHPQSLIPASEPSPWTIWGADQAPYMYWDPNFYLSEYPQVKIPTPPPPQTIQQPAPLDMSAKLEALDAFIEDLNPVSDHPSTSQFQYFAAPTLRKDLVEKPAKPYSQSKPEHKNPNTIAVESASGVSYPVATDIPKPHPKPQHETFDEDEVLDYSKLVCRLCQRQFRELKDLTKHKSLSELHKTNLEDKALLQKVMATIKANKASLYRDRAKEMRQQTGLPEKAPKLVPAPVESVPVVVDNVGSRLLSKMGWKEGQGLGKDGRGIREPIKGKSYSKGAGIGSSQAITDADGQEKYHDRGRRMAWARYHEEEDPPTNN